MVERGDWFVVPNHVTGLHAPERDGVHPMLVGSAWPGPRLSLLPRSASVAEGRIGVRWLDEVRAACQEVSSKFDPAIYALVERAWTRSEIEDLEQEVVVEQLLSQGQLDYILDVAASLVDVQRLLRLRVRRQLVARRRRTVIDRLLVRIGAILEGGNFEQMTRWEPARYRPAGSGLEPIAPSEEDLNRAAAAIRFLPRWLVPNSRNGDFAITKPQVSDLQIVANRHLTPAT